MAACLFLVTIPLLPRTLLLLLASVLGWLGFHLSAKSRKLALANIDIAFREDLTQAEKKSIALESFRVFALTMLDLLWFGFRTKKRIEKYVRFDESFRHYFDTAPVVAVTAHFGNWEIMGQAAALRGFPTMSVAMPLSNPFVDRLLLGFRQRTGQIVVERSGAIKVLIRGLKSGGKVAMLLDQNTLPEDGGEYVKLFGLPAPISKAGVTLANRTDAAAVFCYCFGDSSGCYTAYALEPVKFKDRVEAEAMQELALMLENVIRKHPGKWLWMYKRWKYIPAGHDGKGFPYYSRPATPWDVERTKKQLDDAGG